MITLDASVLIAYFDRADPHHQSAITIINDHADEALCISALTQAEVLVRPAEVNREDEMLGAMRAIGITAVDLSADDVAPLARLRASTRMKMPDACVLLTAQITDSALATFDAALADRARELGVVVVD